MTNEPQCNGFISPRRRSEPSFGPASAGNLWSRPLITALPPLPGFGIRPDSGKPAADNESTAANESWTGLGWHTAPGGHGNPTATLLVQAALNHDSWRLYSRILSVGLAATLLYLAFRHGAPPAVRPEPQTVSVQPVLHEMPISHEMPNAHTTPAESDSVVDQPRLPESPVVPERFQQPVEPSLSSPATPATPATTATPATPATVMQEAESANNLTLLPGHVTADYPATSLPEIQTAVASHSTADAAPAARAPTHLSVPNDPSPRTAKLTGQIQAFTSSN